MKKIIVILGVIGLLCASVSPLWAGGIINKSNISADYFRSLTRHGSTDAADIVAFNPAGVMKMENGFYTKLDILYINKEYSNTVPNQTDFPFSLFNGEDGSFSSDEPSYVPGFFAVYKQDKWAGFFAITVPGGGGEVKFDEGSAYTSVLGLGIWGLTGGPMGPYSGLDSAKIEANSFDIGYTIGGAYEINNMVSVSGGLRYIDAKQEYKGYVDLTTVLPIQDRYDVDLERSATGWGYFLGLNVAPTNKLNMGFLYISNTDLDMESDVTTDTSGGLITDGFLGWADGTKKREDLPGLIGLGVSYQFTPAIRAEVDYTRYLEDNAKLESQSGRYDDAGDSWEVGVSLTYTFNPQWQASIGYLHTDIEGMEPEQLIPLAPELDAKTIGLGAAYAPNDSWRFSFGYSLVNYDSETTSTIGNNSPAGTKLEKDIWAISLGAQYRWF